MDNKIFLNEKDIGALHTWTSPDIEKARSLTMAEKFSRDTLDKELTVKSQLRDKKCWCYDCNQNSSIWVREVQFDLKNTASAEINHALVSSKDYPGPVPGFCLFHRDSGPSLLAEKVYFSRDEMYWGFRPARWFIIFTDGTKTGGSCLEIDPKQLMPNVKEDHIRGAE